MYVYKPSAIKPLQPPYSTVHTRLAQVLPISAVAEACLF